MVSFYPSDTNKFRFRSIVGSFLGVFVSGLVVLGSNFGQEVYPLGIIRLHFSVSYAIMLLAPDCEIAQLLLQQRHSHLFLDGVVKYR